MPIYLKINKGDIQMNEFENQLIKKEETYENSFFPQIPNYRKRGSAFILTNGYGNDIVVDETVTTRQIRKGKYTLLVEISTLPYMKEIRFTSPSRDAAYSFDIYVKAVIQVKDPLAFYENRNLDVDAYFDNIFSMDVRKITKGYSILNYSGMDDELIHKLSSCETIDETTGFSYKISAVTAQPGEQAKEYVKRYGKQRLDAELKENARNQGKHYSLNIEEVLMAEVADGKITEREAYEKITEYQMSSREEHQQYIEGLRNKGFITDKDAREQFKTEMQYSKNLKLEDSREKEKSIRTGLREFYEEEDE